MSGYVTFPSNKISSDNLGNIADRIFAESRNTIDVDTNTCRILLLGPQIYVYSFLSGRVTGWAYKE